MCSNHCLVTVPPRNYMSLISLEYVHVECRMKSSKFILKYPLSINPFTSFRCSLTKRWACELPGRDVIFFCLVSAKLQCFTSFSFCCCLCDVIAALVIASILVLLFVWHYCFASHCLFLVLVLVQHSCCCGHCFSFDAVVHVTLL